MWFFTTAILESSIARLPWAVKEQKVSPQGKIRSWKKIKVQYFSRTMAKSKVARWMKRRQLQLTRLQMHGPFVAPYWQLLSTTHHTFTNTSMTTIFKSVRFSVDDTFSIYPQCHVDKSNAIRTHPSLDRGQPSWGRSASGRILFLPQFHYIWCKSICYFT